MTTPYPSRLFDHDGRDVDADHRAGAPGEEVVGVEAGAAGEVEDAGVGDEGGEGRADVVVFDEGDGFEADEVVGGLDGVVLGGHGGVGVCLWMG